MSRYELYLLIHIGAAVIWAGGGFILLVIARHAEKSADEAKLREWLVTGSVASKVFVPSSIVVLIMGLLMVVDGPWSFGSLWIVLGLLGYLATFLTGILVLEPSGKRIEQRIERDGHLSPEAAVQTRKFLQIVQVDTLVIFLVIADMVIKPTGGDVGVLIGMAAILVAGIALTLVRMRGIESSAATAAATS